MNAAVSRGQGTPGSFSDSRVVRKNRGDQRALAEPRQGECLRQGAIWQQRCDGTEDLDFMKRAAREGLAITQQRGLYESAGGRIRVDRGELGFIAAQYRGLLLESCDAI